MFWSFQQVVQTSDGESTPHHQRLLRFFLSQSVYNVVSQKSIPAQIRQFILYIGMIKDKMTDLCVNELFRNDFIDTFCVIRCVPSSAEPGGKLKRFEELLPEVQARL